MSEDQRTDGNLDHEFWRRALERLATAKRQETQPTEHADCPHAPGVDPWGLAGAA